MSATSRVISPIESKSASATAATRSSCPVAPHGRLLDEKDCPARTAPPKYGGEYYVIDRRLRYSYRRSEKTLLLIQAEGQKKWKKGYRWDSVEGRIESFIYGRGGVVVGTSAAGSRYFPERRELPCPQTGIGATSRVSPRHRKRHGVGTHVTFLA